HGDDKDPITRPTVQWPPLPARHPGDTAFASNTPVRAFRIVRSRGQTMRGEPIRWGAPGVLDSGWDLAGGGVLPPPRWCSVAGEAALPPPVIVTGRPFGGRRERDAARTRGAPRGGDRSPPRAWTPSVPTPRPDC